MKNKIKLFGIIALVAVIGFSMVACGDNDDDDNPGVVSPFNGTWTNEADSDDKITITGGSNWTRGSESGTLDYESAESPNKPNIQVDNQNVGYAEIVNGKLEWTIYGSGATTFAKSSSGNPGGDNTGGDNTGGDNTGGDNTGGENSDPLLGMWYPTQDAANSEDPASAFFNFASDGFVTSVVSTYRYTITNGTMTFTTVNNDDEYEWIEANYVINDNQLTFSSPKNILPPIETLVEDQKQFFLSNGYDESEIDLNSITLSLYGTLYYPTILTVFDRTYYKKDGSTDPIGNPMWPTEFDAGGVGSATQWGKTTYPAPLNIGFYIAGGGGSDSAYMNFTGSQLGFRLVSIDGKTLKVKDNSPNEVEYTLCTNWTITSNVLTLSGGDSIFSTIMNTPLAKN